MPQETRREFVQQVAGSALLAGSGSLPALAAATQAGHSKVIVARDNTLHSSGQLDEKRVGALLDRAMASYTGKQHSVEAWKHILRNDKVIALKVNGLGSKGIATHAPLIIAVCERLQAAGIKPGNIIVWDNRTDFVQNCGLTLSHDPNKVRVTSSEIEGYEEQQSSFGVARIKLAKILTRQCDMVIGMPILKDHSMAGLTFAMKNMYGVVDRPMDLHGTGCSPAVADLNCIPVVRQKVRFTIGDALSSVYDGGPGFHPERLWYPNALIVGEDRVAVDHTAWQMLEHKRAEAGMKSLDAAGRPPRYIAVAADNTHALGTNDPARIHLQEV